MMAFLILDAANAQIGSEIVLTGDGAISSFGESVDIDGDYLIVGEAVASSGGPPGSAYIFKQEGEGWTQQARFVADNNSDTNFFGYDNHVTIWGDYAAVGARWDSGPSVYIYEGCA